MKQQLELTIGNKKSINNNNNNNNNNQNNNNKKKSLQHHLFQPLPTFIPLASGDWKCWTSNPEPRKTSHCDKMLGSLSHHKTKPCSSWVQQKNLER